MLQTKPFRLGSLVGTILAEVIAPSAMSTVAIAPSAILAEVIALSAILAEVTLESAILAVVTAPLRS